MTTIINKSLPFLCLFGLLFFAFCNSPQQPKPHGYFRIDLPEKEYQTFEHDKFTFRYPKYASIVIDPFHTGEKNWLNIDFSAFNAKVHVSYFELKNNFDTLAEDARFMAFKHVPKANAIKQTYVENEKTHVYGLIYDIEGTGSASPCQFFLSDTTDNFLRGALYFNLTPNNDSLAPVIQFLRTDIDTMVYSLKWKNVR